MKDTGVVKKLDELGRVVIPSEIRKSFNYTKKQSIGIYIDQNENIIIDKKEKGVVRSLDELGRVVIPNGIRKKINLKKDDLLNIYIDEGDVIVLKKYEKTLEKINERVVKRLLYFTNQIHKLYSINSCILKVNENGDKLFLKIDNDEKYNKLIYKELFNKKIECTIEKLNKAQYKETYKIGYYEIVFFMNEKFTNEQIKNINYFMSMIED